MASLAQTLRHILHPAHGPSAPDETVTPPARGQLAARALAAARKVDWVPPLLARLVLGGMFLGTGWGKLHSLPKVSEYFASLGLPAPAFLAGLVATTEFVCGLLLVVGLLTRIAALPLIVVMTVAILSARWSEVSSVSDFLGLIEVSYVVILIWLAIAGPGRASVDAVLAHAFGIKEWKGESK